MYSKLKKYIEQDLQIDSENAQSFVEQFELQSFSKGEYFLRNGELCKQIAFINKGAMYCVYNKEGIDKVDEFCPQERQKYVMERIEKVMDKEFAFEDKDTARKFFQELRSKVISWNSSEFESEDFKRLEKELEAKLA